MSEWIYIPLTPAQRLAKLVDDSRKREEQEQANETVRWAKMNRDISNPNSASRSNGRI